MSSNARHQPDRDEFIRGQLIDRGIRDRRVLDAMRRVPRHRFVTPETMDRAYEDSALPIACSQTISQPYIVAHMTELLLRSNPVRVLEIGTGSGYQTAILAELCCEVFTIEWHPALSHFSESLLRDLGYRNIRFRIANGRAGWPEFAPFDGILIAAGSVAVPKPLIDQLALNGTLVAPIGPANEQSMMILVRTRDGFVENRTIGCRFVPLLDSPPASGALNFMNAN